MFDSREWPGRRNKKSADVLLRGEFAVHFGKAKVVADAEAKTQTAKVKGCEAITRSKARLFFDGRDGIQMSLAILSSDIAARIDENLGVVN